MCSRSISTPKIQTPQQEYLALEKLKKLQARNGKDSGFYLDTNTQVSDTLSLSPEAQEVQERFHIWLENNSEYAQEHQIAERVQIKNDGIYLGGQILKWSGHTFGGQSVETAEKLAKQPYTIAQISDMIVALGGEELDGNFSKNGNTYTGTDGQKVGGTEISLFLSEVTGVVLGSFQWSSSRYDYIDCAWGINLTRDGVFVCREPRLNRFSSFSS